MTITTEMKRIAHEVAEARRARQQLTQELRDFVALNRKKVASIKTEALQIQAQIRDAQVKSASRARTERVSFVSTLKANVDSLMNDFKSARLERENQNRKGRQSFIHKIQQDVSELLKSYSNAQSLVSKTHAIEALQDNALRATSVHGLRSSIRSQLRSHEDDRHSSLEAWLGPRDKEPPLKTDPPREDPAPSQAQKAAPDSSVAPPKAMEAETSMAALSQDENSNPSGANGTEQKGRKIEGKRKMSHKSSDSVDKKANSVELWGESSAKDR